MVRVMQHSLPLTEFLNKSLGGWHELGYDVAHERKRTSVHLLHYLLTYRHAGRSFRFLVKTKDTGPVGEVSALGQRT
jgi:hypothetical protein